MIPISIESNITKRDIFTDQESKRTGIGCGERGNVYDRVFDCALRIKDSYGKAKYTGGNLQNRQSYKFGKDPTDSRDSMWFLANCPRNARVYQCAWLSPELVAEGQYSNWNPAMDTGDFAPFPFNETENGPEMGRYAKKRMLWSGMLFVNGNVLREIFWAFNPYRGDEYNGNQYTKHGGFAIGRDLRPDTRVWWHKRDIRDKNKRYDICSQKSGQNSASGVWLPQGLNFRVPTYPQIELLTGAPGCNGLDGFTEPWRCVDYRKSHGQIFGLGASIVPGFYNKDTSIWLWSSSWFYICSREFFGCMEWDEHAWAFNLDDGSVAHRDERDVNAVRCVTMDVDEIPEY